MIEALVGGKAAEQVMMYMQNYSEGHASAIASTFGTNVSAIQRQLQKFELAGILVSQLKGKTRVYSWNPRFPMLTELQVLLDKSISLLPITERKKYFSQRTRPRRSGKPL